MSRFYTIPTVLAALCAFPLLAQAGTVSSVSGAGCLDINMSAPTGGEGAGFDVIAWPDCHGGANQQWMENDGYVAANVNGQDWCLDIDMGAPTGGENAGFNVIAWPDCHGGPNQLWDINE